MGKAAPTPQDPPSEPQDAAYRPTVQGAPIVDGKPPIAERSQG